MEERHRERKSEFLLVPQAHSPQGEAFSSWVSGREGYAGGGTVQEDRGINPRRLTSCSSISKTVSFAS